MLFEKMEPSSRLWIYQSNKRFKETHMEFIYKTCDQFVGSWLAHQEKLDASYEIVYQQFIMFAVNEEVVKVSGCSIDYSLSLIKKIEQKTSFLLLNRELLAYRVGNDIQVVSRENFVKKINKGEIMSDTIVFNNLINCIADLDKWEIPFEKSWYVQLLE